MTVLVVTGTGTGVGKTIVTAALACHARQAGIDVAVCKPLQTGTQDGDDALVEVGRLSGVTELAGLARYPQPLAPVAAAEEAVLFEISTCERLWGGRRKLLKQFLAAGDALAAAAAAFDEAEAAA